MGAIFRPFEGFASPRRQVIARRTPISHPQPPSSVHPLNMVATYFEHAGLFLLFPVTGTSRIEGRTQIGWETRDGSNEENVCNHGCVGRRHVGSSCAWRRIWRWRIWWWRIRLFAGAFVPDQRPGTRDSRRFWLCSRPPDADQWISVGTPRRIGLCARQDQALEPNDSVHDGGRLTSGLFRSCMFRLTCRSR